MPEQITGTWTRWQSGRETGGAVPPPARYRRRYSLSVKMCMCFNGKLVDLFPSRSKQKEVPRGVVVNVLTGLALNGLHFECGF